MSGVTPLKSKSQTDWNNDLRSQPTHYSCSKDNDGYYMIATNIPLSGHQPTFNYFRSHQIR